MLSVFDNHVFSTDARVASAKHSHAVDQGGTLTLSKDPDGVTHLYHQVGVLLEVVGVAHPGPVATFYAYQYSALQKRYQLDIGQITQLLVRCLAVDTPWLTITENTLCLWRVQDGATQFHIEIELNDPELPLQYRTRLREKVQSFAFSVEKQGHLVRCQSWLGTQVQWHCASTQMADCFSRTCWRKAALESLRGLMEALSQTTRNGPQLLYVWLHLAEQETCQLLGQQQCLPAEGEQYSQELCLAAQKVCHPLTPC